MLNDFHKRLCDILYELQERYQLQFSVSEIIIFEILYRKMALRAPMEVKELIDSINDGDKEINFYRSQLADTLKLTCLEYMK